MARTPVYFHGGYMYYVRGRERDDAAVLCRVSVKSPGGTEEVVSMLPFRAEERLVLGIVNGELYVAKRDEVYYNEEPVFHVPDVLK